MSRILVCGGRKYEDWDTLYYILDTNVDPKTDIIIEGAADGADRMAAVWASEAGCALAEVPALWSFYEKRAGTLRNEWMMWLQPEKVIAFPGGRGTAHMIKLAKEAGVEVIEIE